MMSVLEYAQDVNKTVTEILNLCKKLNIPATDENDELDEDAITELDNSLVTDEEEELEYEEELIEKENKKQEQVTNSFSSMKQTQTINNKNKVNKRILLYINK